MPVVRPEALHRLCSDIVVALGASVEAAEVVAEGLVDANLAGHDSHGGVRIPQYAAAVEEGVADPRARPVLEREDGGVLAVAGRRAFGQVVGRFAVDSAVQRLAGNGQRLAAVVARQSYHVGRLGAYVERVAALGYVGLAMVNNHGTRQWVAPYGGRERRLSTNPIAFAAPWAGGAPLLVDLTTSVVAEGKVRVLRNRGVDAPGGWMVDGQGRATRNVEDLYASPPGALLPLGGVELGHKGFGLSLMVEVLAGALSGAGCSRRDADWPGNGMFLLVIDPAGFPPAAGLADEVEGLVRHVKDTPLMEGFTEILAPGEPEARARARRAVEGIPVDEPTWAQVMAVGKRYGVHWDGEAAGTGA